MSGHESHEAAIKKRMRYAFGALSLTLIFALGFGLRLHEVELQSYLEVSRTLTESSNQSIKLWMENQRRMTQAAISTTSIEAFIAAPKNSSLKEAAEKAAGLFVGRYPQLNNLQILMLNNPEQPWSGKNEGNFKLDGQNVEARHLSYQKGLEETGAAEAMIERSPYFISAIYSDDAQKPVFDISVPVMKGDQLTGILTLTLKFSNLTDALINQTDYRQTGYLFLIDDRGKTIAHRNSSYILSNADYLQDIVNKLLTHLSLGEHLFRGNFQGADKLYYGVETGLDKSYMRNQWYLVFTQKEWEIYALSRQFWVVAAVFVLLQIVALWRLIRVFKEDNLLLKQQAVQLDSHELLQEEIRNKHNEVVRQTNLDAFTQLGHFQNVQRVVDRLMQNANGANLTISLFHLDRMGQFNEQYGLAQGDIVIYHIGKLLREHFGETEYVGRVYGDVFSIILPGFTLIESVVALEKFKKRYTELELELIKAKPTLSFGVVQWQGELSGELILKAEQQLKRAKQTGVNQMKY